MQHQLHAERQKAGDVAAQHHEQSNLISALQADVTRLSGDVANHETLSTATDEKLKASAAALEALFSERDQLDRDHKALLSSNEQSRSDLAKALKDIEEERTRSSQHQQQNGELQDALTALETLEKALMESHGKHRLSTLA